jgi:hypothetical protein
MYEFMLSSTLLMCVQLRLEKVSLRVADVCEFIDIWASSEEDRCQTRNLIF